MCTWGDCLQFNSVNETKLFVFDFSTDAAPLLCCLIEEVAQFAANFTWGGRGWFHVAVVFKRDSERKRFRYDLDLLCYFIIGFNCSLFAYGQTGAGKSYSMVGYGNNKLVNYPDRVKSLIL